MPLAVLLVLHVAGFAVIHVDSSYLLLFIVFILLLLFLMYYYYFTFLVVTNLFLVDFCCI